MIYFKTSIKLASVISAGLLLAIVPAFAGDKNKRDGQNFSGSNQLSQINAPPKIIIDRPSEIDVEAPSTIIIDRPSEINVEAPKIIINRPPEINVEAPKIIIDRPSEIHIQPPAKIIIDRP